MFNIPSHGLPPESAVYGEGFQMLHQNGGTLLKHENIGAYADNRHYRITYIVKELRPRSAKIIVAKKPGL